jgi:spore coat protein CotF
MSANTCANEAYEVFLFMNQQGQYQVPTIQNHTAKTLLHSFQPAEQQDYSDIPASSMLNDTPEGIQQ